MVVCVYRTHGRHCKRNCEPLQLSPPVWGRGRGHRGVAEGYLNCRGGGVLGVVGCVTGVGLVNSGMGTASRIPPATLCTHSLRLVN